MSTKRVHYEGRVQGVGFRYTVKSLAAGFDVIGSVCNLADGRVELLVQGETDEVDDFLAAIRESALAGHIQREQADDAPPLEGAKGFQIRG